MVALDKTAGVKLTLKTIREMRRLSRPDAAKAIGVSVDTLSNYERGKSYPSIPVLRKIEKCITLIITKLFFYHLITVYR